MFFPDIGIRRLQLKVHFSYNVKNDPQRKQQVLDDKSHIAIDALEKQHKTQ